MAADQVLSFDSIFYYKQQLLLSAGGVTAPNSQQPIKESSPGKFKMAQGGIGWKEATTGQVMTLKQGDIKGARWFKGFHGGWCLAVEGADSAFYFFHGFPADAETDIQSFLTEAAIPFERSVFDKRGWTWGQLEVAGDNLVFTCQQDEEDIDSPPCIQVPCSLVKNVQVTGRAELSVEFNDPVIAELKFSLPGKTTVVESDDDNGEEVDEERRLEKELLREQVDTAALLCEQLKQAAGLEEAANESIVALKDVSCLIPRGRYDLDFGPNGMRMQGRTYDHRVPYANLQKLAVVPKADDYHVLVIVQVDPALRHGQTRYPFVVFSLPKDELVQVDCNADLAKDRKLPASFDGPTYEVLATIIRQLAGQKILAPAPELSKFASSQLPCVRCSNKANEGNLYPLERSLLFLPKPCLLLPYTDIQSVVIGRSSSGMRSFDLKIVPKASCTVMRQDMALSGLPKEDLQAVIDLFTQRDVRVEDESAALNAVQAKKRSLAEAEDDDDVDMDGGDGSSTDEDYDEGASEEESVDEEYDEDYESDEEDERSDDDASDGASDGASDDEDEVSEEDEDASEDGETD